MMKKTMVLLVVVCACVGGCDKEKFVSQTDSNQVITAKDYERLSPASRREFEPTAVKVVEDLTPALAPLAAVVPYGTAVLGLIGGLAAAYKKYRPIVEDLKKDSIALRQVVKGIEYAGKTTALKDALSDSTEKESKRRIASIKVSLNEKIEAAENEIV